MYCHWYLLFWDGVYNPKDGEKKAISKVLNKFSRLLIEEYMVDAKETK